MQAEAQHRQHAVIEQINADLIAGPLAHLPSGRFNANTAWLTCAGIAHNLTRAAGHLAAGAWPTARTTTIRTRIVNVAAASRTGPAPSTCIYPSIGPGRPRSRICSPLSAPHPADRRIPTGTRRPDHKPRTPPHPSTTPPEQADHVIGDSAVPQERSKPELFNRDHHEPHRWIET